MFPCMATACVNFPGADLDSVNMLITFAALIRTSTG